MADLVDEVYAAVTDVSSAEAVVADGYEVAVLCLSYGRDTIWTAMTYSIEEVLLVVGGKCSCDYLILLRKLVEYYLSLCLAIKCSRAVIARVALSLSDCPLFCLGDSDGDGLKLARLSTSIEVEFYVA